MRVTAASHSAASLSKQEQQPERHVSTEPLWLRDAVKNSRTLHVSTLVGSFGEELATSKERCLIKDWTRGRRQAGRKMSSPSHARTQASVRTHTHWDAQPENIMLPVRL